MKDRLEASSAKGSETSSSNLRGLLRKERLFLILIAILFLTAGFIYPFPTVARWFGFAVAAYSAIANDSIQTIGTFIASNRSQKWWKLWLFIGSIFVIVVFISWKWWEGDVSYQRLSTKGFDTAPAKFAFLQLAAPIFLLIITRLRMPVSTTFLLLSSFTTDYLALIKVLEKSVSGYLIAFFFSLGLWWVFERYFRRIQLGKAADGWIVAQWITSGILWSIWIMQDAANIAVYLPRQLNLTEFLMFAGFIFCGLAILFYLKGDRIQEIVNEKSNVTDVRAATFIDLVYAVILIIFQWISTIPMSTTWVFIGLLGGRELAIRLREIPNGQHVAFKLIIRDLVFASTGLVISIMIATAVNPVIRSTFLNYLKDLTY